MYICLTTPEEAVELEKHEPLTDVTSLQNFYFEKEVLLNQIHMFDNLDAEKMGQKASQQLALKDSKEVPVVCEVVSEAIVHAAQKLKEYLGFEYPPSKLCPAANTLNEIFLIHFIAFCQEKGVDEWLTTTKMTKHQAFLFGADWIWTFWGSDKQIKLQLAVQTLQMSSPPPVESKPCDLSNPESRVEESSWKKSRFDKLEEFCKLIGEDCLGLFLIFGMPGKPKDIRGVVLDSVKSQMVRSHLPGGKAVAQFVLETEDCVFIKELLRNCLSKKDGLREVGKVYISIL
ncbi:rab15 effector protein [Nomascus leucogenys]|uniref:rab15 effector protein n=1 Tax=Nomascus leucogenys TaxID=61853 RepID=UPI00122D6755|nr:rab15 effector protein [Nomascus leucogenys]